MATRKRLTLHDIARDLGTSTATVSYALNNSGRVSPEVTRKVVDYAEKVGYRTNRLAKATRTGRTETIGLVLPTLTNPFFPEIAQAVHEAAKKQGYSVFLVDCQLSEEDEKDGIERLADYNIDGIIWCPLEDHSVSSVNVDCPVVLFDRPVKGYDSVFADFAKGGRLQGEHAIANGHGKIGILSGPTRSPGAVSRRKGLYKALKDQCDIAWDFSMEYGLDIPEHFQEPVAGSDVSCIICANDTLAIALLRLMKKSGKQVPQDVSIIGFDDIDWASLVTPPLTTIELPIRETGYQAFELLFHRLQEPDAKTKHVILDVNLLERESFTRYAD